MKSVSRIEKTDARRLVEASAWRTHLTETDQDSTPAFEAWLASEDGNRAAWDRVRQAWDLFGEQATAPELLDLRRAALSQVRAVGRRRWLGGAATGFSPLAGGRLKWVAMAAGVAVLAVGAFVSVSILGPDVYRTAAGERRVVTLSDGSKIQLDSLTELRVDYSEKARDLKLIKGQARFDVAHDVERPFSVLAAGQKVIATGTAFNIDLLDRKLYVTLIEGKVVILPQNSKVPPAQVVANALAEKGQNKDQNQDSGAKLKAPPAAREAQPAKAVELQAGQQFSVSESGTPAVARANVQRTTAWQTGQLVFENEPLSSVVERVNRYAARPVSLADEQIASLRISGVFNTGDVDGFVTTITHYLPIKADQSGEEIRLSANSSAPAKSVLR